jgi:hypothetical protein
MVTASEAASYVFCAEAWRLEHGLGLESGNREDLDAWTRHHARKAVAERVAGGSIGLGRALVVLAVLGVLVLWVLSRAVRRVAASRREYARIAGMGARGGGSDTGGAGGGGGADGGRSVAAPVPGLRAAGELRADVRIIML